MDSPCRRNSGRWHPADSATGCRRRSPPADSSFPTLHASISGEETPAANIVSLPVPCKVLLNELEVPSFCIANDAILARQLNEMRLPATRTAASYLRQEWPSIWDELERRMSPILACRLVKRRRLQSLTSL